MQSSRLEVDASLWNSNSDSQGSVHITHCTETTWHTKYYIQEHLNNSLQNNFELYLPYVDLETRPSGNTSTPNLKTREEKKSAWQNNSYSIRLHPISPSLPNFKQFQLWVNSNSIPAPDLFYHWMNDFRWQPHPYFECLIFSTSTESGWYHTRICTVGMNANVNVFSRTVQFYCFRQKFFLS